MINKTLPTRHISARVPWHDNKWNGKTCCNVLDNSFCRILPLIDNKKDAAIEIEDQLIDGTNMPPCVAEKGTFLSPHPFSREVSHSWSHFNSLFKEFLPMKYFHKPFSFNAVPFLWMMKKKGSAERPHYSDKAGLYELDYDVDLEKEVDSKLGFDGNTWVQHPHNQKVLLDAFFGCLKKEKSLVFFYSKETPLSEPNERVVVGVAKVRNNPSNILEYEYPPGYNGHKSYPWDRCVEHTLTDKQPDGFLLPYHEILEFANKNNPDIDLRDYVAFAGDHFQFSYASELVEHDTAIDTLLNIAESLRKSQELLGKSFTSELDWIDEQISQIWDMRGGFPGMGSILTALQFENGNTIAWEIENHINKKDGNILTTNPWMVFEESILDPEKYFGKKGATLFTPTAQKVWKYISASKKELYKLLSRCQLNNDQAKNIIEPNAYSASVEDIKNNLYLIYEIFRKKGLNFTFNQIDKALLPPEKIRQAFPLPTESALTDDLDLRRMRALTVSILENSSLEGHSLLPINNVIERIKEKTVNDSFPISTDILTAIAEEEFFRQEVLSILPSKDNHIHFLKLNRLQQMKEVIRQRININKIKTKPYNIDKDWLQIVNNHLPFNELKKSDQDEEDEKLAREEKAQALKILTNYSFSVLIGPAGSGKTTLLEIFEQLPEIKNGGLLKLAPTGKARVKLGSNAKTLAQFLHPHRYDAASGNYHINPGILRSSNYKNVIIDEASMLTEEQLAALFDSLGPVDRIILVGDYRQLPPIGTGRPFVDIINQIKPENFPQKNIFSADAYAELKKIRRQTTVEDRRWDVELSRCFGDNPTKEDLEVFHAVSSGKISSKHIRLVKWYDSKDFREKFESAVTEELELNPEDIENSFNQKIGGTLYNNKVYFKAGISEKAIEQWQVLSPVNGYGYGVKEINKFFQKKYRSSYIADALNIQNGANGFFQKRKIAKPVLDDNIVYGDKVINLKNTTWENWQQINPYSSKNEALNYIANGEIGILTGEYRGVSSVKKGDFKIEIAFSTQPGYSYVFKEKDLGPESKYSFELAYAITVHKSQGSGFKKVFFVMPSKGAIMSKELLYTALTRQEDKIIIFHQGDFRDFIKLVSTEASATAKRFTDLFNLPDIKQIEKKWYDARYINISERGEPMISKNEVIIANCLHKYNDNLTYAYEDKLVLTKPDRVIKPDFTIDNLTTGKRFYWEHLGMMSNEVYREKWLQKLKAYKEEGFVLFEESNETNEKILIITEENPNGGINSQSINDIIKKYILEI
ncbi:AAA family ATPase [Marnyiella aurantia]|uniref:AAA family ATPase n=1 Tax=Marnyiella aurantia TaxID=2758037 RepID=A0A7D7LMS6_9FLAO|nr:AAA family ATPase [Marnyiella aurantia]MBA5245897.1 AAA family ATPase [Marnyiella aurantia]QMS98704.1 AAA family ATPase [Marnyiella aurantia]